MSEKQKPVISPLGDSALVVSWGNTINLALNENVIVLSEALREKPFEGLLDVVPAYSSLGVIYDTNKLTFENKQQKSAYQQVKEHIQKMIRSATAKAQSNPALVEIPVCYDEALGNDLAVIASAMQVKVEAIVQLHTSRQYHVYMPGFIPGFVYTGEVDEAIAMPRKQKPEQVKAGAVAVAGVQTGIYPAVSPGGWHILGYTPYRLFDSSAKDDPCLLHAGDSVQFRAICMDDYEKMKTQLP